MKYLASVLLISYSLLFFNACGSLFPNTALVLLKSSTQITNINANGIEEQFNLELSDIYITGNGFTTEKKDAKYNKFTPLGITWFGKSPTSFKIYSKLNDSLSTEDIYILTIASIQQNQKIFITITAAEIDATTGLFVFKIKVE